MRKNKKKEKRENIVAIGNDIYLPEWCGVVWKQSHDLRRFTEAFQHSKKVVYFPFTVRIFIVQNGSVSWMVWVFG